MLSAELTNPFYILDIDGFPTTHGDDIEVFLSLIAREGEIFRL